MNEGIKVATLSGVAIAVLAGALFIAFDKVAWGIFFELIAVILAIITKKI